MADALRAEADDERMMTVEEFRAWAERREGIWELVNGRPRAMVGPSSTHASIHNRAGYLLEKHLEETGSPCRPLTAPPVIPRSFARHNARIPDLVVTCEPSADGDWDVKNPILIIEVLSPRNAADTRENVVSYMSTPSLRDILILHSTTVRGELITREPGGVWPDPLILLGANTLVTLPSIGLSVPLKEFYKRTHLLTVEA